jgi:hypothetical protein
MKMGSWRFGTHKASAPASELVPALDRVREMREHSEWQPVTPPDTIQQRSDRVAAAREHITIPPLAGEHGTNALDPRQLNPWLESFRPFLYGSLALILVFALALYIEPKPPRLVTINIAVSTIGFRLPEYYPYASLTDNQAEYFARRALRSIGLNSSDWSVDNYPTQLRRAGAFEGTVVFRYKHDPSELVRVTVNLESEEKRIVCTIYPH